MHKSISDLFNKDGSQRPITDEVLNGLSIKDRDKALAESNKKLIVRVLNLVDSGTPVPNAIKKAKDESYPQPAAISVVEQSGLAQVAHDVAHSVAPETMDLARTTLQKRAQDEIVGAVVEAITVYPPAIGDKVKMDLRNSIKDPAFVAETNAKIEEAIAGVLGK